MAEVFKLLDKDFICVRHTVGSTNFLDNNGGKFLVPIIYIDRYHVDTIRYERLNDSIIKMIT